MASIRQIEANRRNSQHSTGPRTPEGKAASRFNALKSGINAKAQVIPGEDPADLQALDDGYTRDWAPQTHHERFLVDTLVRNDWLLQRLTRIEAELSVHQMSEARKLTFSKLDEDSPMGDVYSRACDKFTRLQRRIDSTQRAYDRAIIQLKSMRRGPGDDNADGPGPGPALGLPPHEDESPAPSAPDCPNEANSAPVGFVAEFGGWQPASHPSLTPSLKPHGCSADWLLGNYCQGAALDFTNWTT